MVEITFDFDTEGTVQEDPWLDSYELTMLFDQTRRSLENSLHHQLDHVVCDEHGAAARIRITGRFNHETEQMDLDYNIDTCCQMFLVRVIKMLNNT